MYNLCQTGKRKQVSDIQRRFHLRSSFVSVSYQLILAHFTLERTADLWLSEPSTAGVTFLLFSLPVLIAALLSVSVSSLLGIQTGKG